MQASLALLWGPADEPITRSHLPGTGAKPEHREYLLLAGRQVAQLCSRQRGVAEVVVAIHILAPQQGFCTVGHRPQLQVRQLVHAGCDRQLWLSLGGTAAPQATVATAPLRWRQADQSVTLHAQQRHPAAHVFQLGVGTAPVEALTYQPRQGQPMPARIFGDQAADQPQFLRAELAPAVTHRLRQRAAVARARLGAGARRRGSRVKSARNQPAPCRQRGRRHSDTRSARYAG